MNIGYARVSTADQNLDLQRTALLAAGVDLERIYEETGSGADDRRPVLGEVLRTLRGGDVLVVWKLDRLGRSMSHLNHTIEQLGKREIGFRSITEGMDTTTPIGMLVFHVAGAYAQFERDIIIERTMAGLREARERGRVGGRRHSLALPDCREVRTLYDSRAHTVAWIAKRYQVSRKTIYRALLRCPSPEAVTDAVAAIH